jgi:hypothetical protein
MFADAICVGNKLAVGYRNVGFWASISPGATSGIGQSATVIPLRPPRRSSGTGRFDVWLLRDPTHLSRTSAFWEADCRGAIAMLLLRQLQLAQESIEARITVQPSKQRITS